MRIDWCSWGFFEQTVSDSIGLAIYPARANVCVWHSKSRSLIGVFALLKCYLADSVSLPLPGFCTDTYRIHSLFWVPWLHRTHCLTFTNNLQTKAILSNAMAECIFIKKKIHWKLVPRLFPQQRCCLENCPCSTYLRIHHLNERPKGWFEPFQFPFCFNER